MLLRYTLCRYTIYDMLIILYVGYMILHGDYTVDTDKLASLPHPLLLLIYVRKGCETEHGVHTFNSSTVETDRSLGV